MDRSFLDDLLPWSPNLPANCRKPGKVSDYEKRFRNYWNNNVAICNVPILAISCHANQDLICLYGAGHGFKKELLKELGFIFPKIDYAVFLGCNLVYSRNQGKPLKFQEPNPDPSDSTAKWIENTVNVKYLLDEAKKIILETFEGETR